MQAITALRRAGKRLTHDRDLMGLVVLLRYGATAPRPGDKPILNKVTVARVTKLSPATVTRILERYWDTGDKGDKQQTQGWRKLLGHHVAYLVHPATLQAWAPLSLAERSVLFHRQYPETTASPSTISRVYRRHGVKFKQIKRGKRAIDFATEHYGSLLTKMTREVTEALASGLRIVYLDEAIFSHSTGPARAWAHRNEVIEVDEARFNMKTQALIMAVSPDRGVDHFRLYPRSVATHQFLEFLEELSAANGHEPLAVFMDNMTVHHSRLALQKYQELGITPIFNVMYSPQFNSIESVFSMVKAAYKKSLLKDILEESQKKRTTLIKEAILGLDPDKIAKCLAHSMNEI